LIEFQNFIHLQIVGWGNTENKIKSPVLLEASLPYIDRSTCRNFLNNGFELFVTVDKFCAGSASGNKIFIIFFYLLCWLQLVSTFNLAQQLSTSRLNKIKQ